MIPCLKIDCCLTLSKKRNVPLLYFNLKRDSYVCFDKSTSFFDTTTIYKDVIKVSMSHADPMGPSCGQISN
jgi:hypothetical protein